MFNLDKKVLFISEELYHGELAVVREGKGTYILFNIVSNVLDSFKNSEPRSTEDKSSTKNENSFFRITNC